MTLTSLLERDLLPDALVRLGIKRLLRRRLHDEHRWDPVARQERLMHLIDVLRKSPIAVHTRDANEQHYEVPTAFFTHVLGRHMKYSCGYWNEGVDSLDRSEADMLALTCERAELRNGQRVLELGCGWGSLTLFMAERYPKSRFTAVSNSRTQKAFIDAEAKKRRLTNITVVTSDMNDFRARGTFDRVVSVEMFEHMRNYEALLKKVASFLKSDGKLFVHIFSHTAVAYLFEVKDRTDWMSKYFFTGGIMPSDHLLFYFPDHLAAERHWNVSGDHYRKTSEAWLARMDRNRDRIMPILAATYGAEHARKWWVYWRVFFMSCAELWGYRDGTEWIVSHYLFRKKTVGKSKKEKR